MSKLIEILPNIYGLKIPFDYNESDNNELQQKIRSYCFDFKILGTLTKDEISFDASEIVDSTEIDIEQYDGILVATPRFWDYETESFSLSNSNESFRSALPEEIFFEHPEGDLKYCCNSSDCGCLGFPINIVSKEHWEDYQITQENITEKLLILQKL